MFDYIAYAEEELRMLRARRSQATNSLVRRILDVSIKGMEDIVKYGLPLAPGERLVDGEIMYSAAWLDDPRA